MSDRTSDHAAFENAENAIDLREVERASSENPDRKFSQHALDGAGPLRIVHVLRAPVGGLFRHVLDLAGEQAARGHRVGVIADSLTGGARAESALAALAPRLALGLCRLPIHRLPHPSDLLALSTVSRRLDAWAADILHGHGSK